MISRCHERGDEDEKLFLADDVARMTRQRRGAKKREKRIRLRLLVLSEIRGSIRVRSSV